MKASWERITIFDIIETKLQQAFGSDKEHIQLTGVEMQLSNFEMHFEGTKQSNLVDVSMCWVIK